MTEKRLTSKYSNNRQKQAVIRTKITACFAYYVQTELYTSYVLNKKQAVVILYSHSTEAPDVTE